MFGINRSILLEYYHSSLCCIVCICKCAGFQFRQRMTWLAMRKFLKLCVDDTRFMGFNASTSDSARAQRTVNCLLRGGQVCNITAVGKKNRGFPVGTRPTALIKETVSSRSEYKSPRHIYIKLTLFR